MAEKLLTTDQVLERVPFGITWLNERVAAGEFPKPVHKWRRNLWLEKVVDDWIIANFSASPANQPKPVEAHAAH